MMSDDPTQGQQEGGIYHNNDADNTTGRLSTSTQGQDEWNPMDLEEEPSFEFDSPKQRRRQQQFNTSTPQKPNARRSIDSAATLRKLNYYSNSGPNQVDASEYDDRVGDQHQQRDDRGDDDDEGQARQLTKRRLANLVSVGQSSTASQLFNTATGRSQQSFLALNPMYAPSPSTGSSTLVDPREDELLNNDVIAARRRGAKGKGKATDEMLNDVLIEERVGDDEEFYRERINTKEEDEMSSPRINSKPTPRRRLAGDLESYVSSHTLRSTPRRYQNNASRASSAPSLTATVIGATPANGGVPPTPHAPGAFPRTIRKTGPATTTATSRVSATSDLQSTPAARNTSGRAQILDAFNRFIEGPNGALTLSAERRAALSRRAAEAEANDPTLRSSLYGSTSSNNRATPHPTGQYPLRTNLLGRSDPLTEQEEREGDTVATSPAINHRKGSTANNFEHVEQMKQRAIKARLLMEGHREERPQVQTRSDWNFGRSGGGEGDLSRDQNPRTQEYEGDDSSLEDADAYDDEEREYPEDDVVQARGGGRSAIDYAMAKSFIASPMKPQIITSTSPRNSPPNRPLTPPSPALPDLPPMPPTPSPQSSPTNRRANNVIPTFRSLVSRIVPNAPRSPSSSPPPLRAASSTAQPSAIENAPSESSFHPSSSTPPRSVKFAPPPSPSPNRTSASSRPLRSPQPKSKSPSKSPTQSPSAPGPSLNSSRPKASDSPSRKHRTTYQGQAQMLIEEDDPDEALRDLVDQLARLVRSRSVENSRQEEEEDDFDPEEGQGMRTFTLETDNLLQEQQRSEKRGLELDQEIAAIVREGELGEATTQDLIQQISETQRLDEKLSDKLDSLRSSLEQLGQNLGAQVSMTIQSRLEEEARKRGNWLIYGVVLQMFLVWMAMCLANYRASRMYDSSFIDPFSHPALFYLGSETPTRSISPETLSLFSPLPRRFGLVNSASSFVGSSRLVQNLVEGIVGRIGANAGMRSSGSIVERVPL